jgi:hypothetical protein
VRRRYVTGRLTPAVRLGDRSSDHTPQPVVARHEVPLAYAAG